MFMVHALKSISLFRSLPRWRVGRKIFVSYRRADTQDIAERLYERLARQFGATNVFMDRADIEHGQRWRDEVTRQIAAADMFVVLIGPSWLDTLRARAAAEDVLRTELTSALEQKKQIIPVLVGGTAMPDAMALPPEVRGLAEFQALPLTLENMDWAMLGLLGRLKPGWRLAVSWGFGQLFGWLAGILILIAALGIYGWMNGEDTIQLAAAYPFAAGAFAGALAGACVAAPQWLLLRPWFARARHLLTAYIVLTAIAAGYACSVRSGNASEMVLGFMVFLLPIALAAILWWVVAEKLIHAAWWSAANLLAPVVGLLVAAALHSKADESAADVESSGLSEASSVLADFLLPMILMSLAAGWLLVWLMRQSEIRRR
jgi:hypothetical protein